jgi:thiol-disulfide isomerase/thioredoxin
VREDEPRLIEWEGLVRYRPLILLAVAMCVVAGCGETAESVVGSAPSTGSATSPAEATPDEPSATAQSEPTSAPSGPAVPDILDFTAPTVDNGTFDGASLAGKPAVLWFWAPWCPVCKQGAADVTAAAAELGDDVAFVGVAGLSGSISDMQQFVEETDSGSIAHIADTDGAVFTRFEVAQQDTFAFVDSDGVVELVDGYSSDPDLVGIAREHFGL